MKNLFLSTAAIAMLFSMTSCKKDYSCECRDGNVLETTRYPNTILIVKQI